MRYLLLAGMLTAALMFSIMLCSGDEENVLRYLYDSNQSVKGDGFTSSYSLLTANDLKLKNAVHGSGSYSMESAVHTRQYTRRILTTGSIYNSTDAEVKLNETTDAVYSEVKFDLGGSFKSLPIRSLWAEDSSARNGNSGSAMRGDFDSATSLKKELGARLYYFSDTYEDESTDFEYPTYINDSKSITGLDIAAEFSGAAHICASQEKMGPKYAKMLVDENYLGAFSIEKRMVLTEIMTRRAVNVEWLPCCSGGWEDVDIHDKYGHGRSAEGIFNCTCFKVPSSAEFAQATRAA